MAKRGAKAYEESDGAKLVPYRVIAEQIGESPRAVAHEFHSGIAKLKKTPGAFDALLTLIQIKAVERRMCSSHCGSVECDQNFVQEFGER